MIITLLGTLIFTGETRNYTTKSKMTAVKKITENLFIMVIT